MKRGLKGQSDAVSVVFLQTVLNEKRIESPKRNFYNDHTHHPLNEKRIERVHLRKGVCLVRVRSSMKRGLKAQISPTIITLLISLAQWKEDWKTFLSILRLRSLLLPRSMKRGLKDPTDFDLCIHIHHLFSMKRGLKDELNVLWERSRLKPSMKRGLKGSSHKTQPLGILTISMKRGLKGLACFFFKAYNINGSMKRGLKVDQRLGWITISAGTQWKEDWKYNTLPPFRPNNYLRLNEKRIESGYIRRRWNTPDR